MTLMEDQQAEALRRLGRAIEAVRKAETERAAAAQHARDVGVSVARMAELGKTTRDRVYGWLRKLPPATEPDS